ncbi:glycosyltransferase [Sphingobacterium spiritivorum]|uniref:Glycosyltransferase, group 1 family protein n=1 Tax=Sphingobacterium spiritivorum ATCC 33861 TaxID=525373 RepID=D7VI78_SPHSI|nr:glycosyltransferase [Sphingobacterium spiritivorum]EFK59780.1 glycosyltransferase, group 1 family protein [Sphingobacterium spiritivorum ATCC 33861]QQT37575.1 glycosyltransferase [Sphingobacterium spiritivorum]WQD34372.1 glycosyltransferase [Sphingobacterium spiritivorum]SUI97312.1 Vi polysaccharide biosynthesis protein TviE [Sphingobacterium spiritivorum]
MKVLFIINDLNSGGIENYLLRFLKYYNKKLIPVVLCKSGNKGALENEYLKIEDIEIVPLRIGFLDFKGISSFRNFMKNNNFDSVVDFTGNFAGLTMFISYRVGIKKRITFYRGATNHFKENAIRLFYNFLVNKLVLRFSTDILSNSKAAFNYFFKNNIDNRFEVIYNGIDADQFLNCKDDIREELGIPKDGFVVGHVGRLAREKNHETIWEVAKILCSQHKNIYFILCGKGVDDTYSEMIKELKLTDQIIVLGYRRDVVKVLNSMNVFYFPSLSEGQPNALIEALIAGLPFVASNIEPIKETIPEEYQKSLVNPLDINNAVSKIEDIYINGVQGDNLKKWAITKYNPEVLFLQFFKKL